MMKALNTLILSMLLAAGLVGPARSTVVDVEPALFSQAEIDQMLAPIALYPDTVLSHVLIAATYPFEVVQAARWSRNNPGLQGEAAVAAVERMDWDPSVKALVAFPELLRRMDEDLEWTQRLGDAFLMQEGEILDSIQYLRAEAYEHGSLSTNEYVRVVRETEYIYIEPARTRVVYVPYYDPYVVYPYWRWAHYPPVYWAHPPGYRIGLTFFWGTGFHVAPAYFYFSSFHWPRRQLVVVHHHHHHSHRHFSSGREVAHHSDARRWQHNPKHRHGVSYRQGVDERRFTQRQSATPLSSSLAREAQSRTDRRSWSSTDGRTGTRSNQDISALRDDGRGTQERSRSSSDGVRSALRGQASSPSSAPQRSAQSRTDASTVHSALQNRDSGQAPRNPSADRRADTRSTTTTMSAASSDGRTAVERDGQGAGIGSAPSGRAPAQAATVPRSASRPDASTLRQAIQGRDAGQIRQQPSARQVEATQSRPAVAESIPSRRAEVRPTVPRQAQPAVRSAPDTRPAATTPQQSRQAPAGSQQRPASSAPQRSQQTAPAPTQRPAFSAPARSQPAPAAARQAEPRGARSQPAAPAQFSAPAPTQRSAPAPAQRSAPAQGNARGQQPGTSQRSAPAQRPAPAQRSESTGRSGSSRRPRD